MLKCHLYTTSIKYIFRPRNCPRQKGNNISNNLTLQINMTCNSFVYVCIIFLLKKKKDKKRTIIHWTAGKHNDVMSNDNDHECLREQK